ncbi:MAG: hypothetical protein LLF98_02485 [Clostridium sp.]|uniref:hypothetical protein n=1 Tax=Clostridium sp. TaxID=1506 RepID=UPI0025B94259|nr:hypothetical protein [Clostridium sp.]MCE5220150.1 hypothetical protein [Clostridium sp.]
MKNYIEESLKLDNMEQDLIYACKSWYGGNGIEKVIGDYCGYDASNVGAEAKYHFLSKLLIKLIKNKNINLTELFDDLSPRNINEFGGLGKQDQRNTNEIIFGKMVLLICNLQVKEMRKDGTYINLVDLGEPNEKFRKKEITM